MAVALVERWDVRRDGHLCEASLQQKIESLGYVVVARTYPAALDSAESRDDRASITGIVRGLVKLTIDGEPQILTAGDLVRVPRGCRRRLEVVGPSTALCLEAFLGEDMSSVE